VTVDVHGQPEHHALDRRTDRRPRERAVPALALHRDARVRARIALVTLGVERVEQFPGGGGRLHPFADAASSLRGRVTGNERNSSLALTSRWQSSRTRARAGWLVGS
jgi:hypothetical protein